MTHQPFNPPPMPPVSPQVFEVTVRVTLPPMDLLGYSDLKTWLEFLLNQAPITCEVKTILQLSGPKIPPNAHDPLNYPSDRSHRLNKALTQPDTPISAGFDIPPLTSPNATYPKPDGNTVFTPPPQSPDNIPSDGGPAFPQHGYDNNGRTDIPWDMGFGALSVRDYFAGKAMQTIILIHNSRERFDNVAVKAFEAADAMLKARKANL